MDTFDWIQLSALALFLAVFGVRSVMMFVREGTNPFTLGAGKQGAARALEMLMPVAMIVWIAALLVSTMGSNGDLPAPLAEELVDSGWVRSVGAGMLFASIGLFAWALLSFGSSWRVGIDRSSPGALVTAGVFRFTRNPIFVSMDAFFIGTFLLQGTVFFLVAALVAIAGTHIQILQEEAFLGRQYGADYQRYRAAVPRYLDPARVAGRSRTESSTPASPPAA